LPVPTISFLGSDSEFAPEFVVASTMHELKHLKLFGPDDLQCVFSGNASQLFPKLASLAKG
jgi:hypothetical protein